MYGFPLGVCMSSGLPEEGGAGLATFGLPASKLEAMAQEAGFTRFRITDVEDPFNAYYELRPYRGRLVLAEEATSYVVAGRQVRPAEAVIGNPGRVCRDQRQGPFTPTGGLQAAVEENLLHPASTRIVTST